jgi:hypothetical protein
VCLSAADDDDWENDDDDKLKLPGASGAKDEDVWSDEEGHEAHLQEDEAPGARCSGAGAHSSCRSCVP